MVARDAAVFSPLSECEACVHGGGSANGGYDFVDDHGPVEGIETPEAENEDGGGCVGEDGAVDVGGRGQDGAVGALVVVMGMDMDMLDQAGRLSLGFGECGGLEER